MPITELICQAKPKQKAYTWIIFFNSRNCWNVSILICKSRVRSHMHWKKVTLDKCICHKKQKKNRSTHRNRDPLLFPLVKFRKAEIFSYVNTVDSSSTLKHNGRKQYSGPEALPLTPTQRRSRTIVLRLFCLLCIVRSQRLGPQPLLLCQEQVIRFDMLQALISNNQNHH